MMQVNKLLMEKISSQGDTISQRERELEREREHGFVLFFLPSSPSADVPSLSSNLKASLSTSTSSQEDRKRLEKLENEVEKSREQVKEMEDKLQRAKVVRRFPLFFSPHQRVLNASFRSQFIKDQDKRLRAAESAASTVRLVFRLHLLPRTNLARLVGQLR
jgi:phage-related minor tail protein